jgi:hypothetical protein
MGQSFAQEFVTDSACHLGSWPARMLAPFFGLGKRLFLDKYLKVALMTAGVVHELEAAAAGPRQDFSA